MWERHPQAMRQVTARHDAVLTHVFDQRDGVVVRPHGEGDSLCCVFVRASDAVAAALAGQRALVTEDWGSVGPLRTRMGLHTGEANLREGAYYGSPDGAARRLSPPHPARDQPRPVAAGHEHRVPPLAVPDAAAVSV